LELCASFLFRYCAQPLTMAIINVTGDDLFGRLGESAAPGDETLAKEIPLLLKQIKATAQETERATQLLKHALDLEHLQVTRPSFQARAH
jgi:hypothetical protein